MIISDNKKGLKSVMGQTDRTNLDATKNEVYSQIVQVFDHRSLSLIMRDAEDDGNAAILRDHYTGKGKPGILTLYTQLFFSEIVRYEYDRLCFENGKVVK